jgi:hypothetical protein
LGILTFRDEPRHFRARTVGGNTLGAQVIGYELALFADFWGTCGPDWTFAAVPGFLDLPRSISRCMADATDIVEENASISSPRVWGTLSCHIEWITGMEASHTVLLPCPQLRISRRPVPKEIPKPRALKATLTLGTQAQRAHVHLDPPTRPQDIMIPLPGWKICTVIDHFALRRPLIHTIKME